MDSALPPAPGAKTSRRCRLLAILFGLTCIGAPIGIPLGIVALVKHFKAKRLARQFPDSYLPPPSKGLTLSILSLVVPVVMLPFTWNLGAFAVSAITDHFAHARDNAAISTMNARLPGLAECYGRALETGASAMTIKAELDAHLRRLHGLDKNPYDPQSPAFPCAVGMIQAPTEAEMAAAVRQHAITLGEVIFVMSAPVDPQAPRFVAGAVRTRTPVGGNSVSFKVVRVD